MTIVELVSNPEVRIGHMGPMMVSVWYSQASLSALQTLAEQQRKLIAEYGTISTLSIAVRVPRAPDPEASEWIKTSDKEFKGTSRGSVVVVLERGLAAIIVRSFLVAASLVTTNAMHVVKTIEDAAVKVKSLPGQPAEIVGDEQLAAKLVAFSARA
jgi:hypothetical protein